MCPDDMAEEGPPLENQTCEFLFVHDEENLYSLNSIDNCSEEDLLSFHGAGRAAFPLAASSARPSPSTRLYMPNACWACGALQKAAFTWISSKNEGEWLARAVLLGYPTNSTWAGRRAEPAWSGAPLVDAPGAGGLVVPNKAGFCDVCASADTTETATSPLDWFQINRLKRSRVVVAATSAAFSPAWPLAVQRVLPSAQGASPAVQWAGCSTALAVPLHTTARTMQLGMIQPPLPPQPHSAVVLPQPPSGGRPRIVVAVPLAQRPLPTASEVVDTADSTGLGDESTTASSASRDASLPPAASGVSPSAAGAAHRQDAEQDNGGSPVVVAELATASAAPPPARPILALARRGRGGRVLRMARTHQFRHEQGYFQEAGCRDRWEETKRSVRIARGAPTRFHNCRRGAPPCTRRQRPMPSRRTLAGRGSRAERVKPAALLETIAPAQIIGDGTAARSSGAGRAAEHPALLQQKRDIGGHAGRRGGTTTSGSQVP